MFDRHIKVTPGTGPQVSGRDTLTEVIRKKRLADVDEATADRISQEERTKRMESEAKEAEAGSRKMNAEMAVAERATPPSLVNALIDVLKDRGQQTVSSKEVLEIMDYTKGLVAPGGPEQPPDGMWGFLTALIAGQGNKQFNPMELAEFIQKMQQTQQSAQSRGSLVEQIVALVPVIGTAVDALRKILVPQATGQGSMINIGQGSLPFKDLQEWTQQQFDLTIRAEEFKETRENWRAARENLPKAIDMLNNMADRFGGVQSKPGQGAQGGLAETKPEVVRQEMVIPPGMQRVHCNDCNNDFCLPAEIPAPEIACPVCAAGVMKKAQAEDNSGEQGSSIEL